MYCRAPWPGVFAGGEGKNSGLLCYASDQPREPQEPRRAVSFPLLGGTATACRRRYRYRDADAKGPTAAVSSAAPWARCLADALEQGRWRVLAGTRRENIHGCIQPPTLNSLRIDGAAGASRRNLETFPSQPNAASIYRIKRFSRDLRKSPGAIQHATDAESKLLAHSCSSYTTASMCCCSTEA